MTKYILTLLLVIIGISLTAQNPTPELTNASTSGTLKVTVTTSATGNTSYDPNNIVAIWVQDSSGKFVKTLLVYAGTRKQYLTNWISSSSSNTVDATTGSTQTSHTIRTCNWNGTNASKVIVADGTYTIKMELTDKNSTGNMGTFTFTKSQVAQKLSPLNSPSFSSITLEWTPVNTAINDVELEKMYSVYPNPTVSSIFITGTDIKEVEICSLNGKSIFTSKEQKVNLSRLPKGLYLAVIRAKAGTIVKKIEKR